MALSDVAFDSKDFEWNRAPLASMEDLSVVNTPIPTPTAGQSPKSRARWSHRSSTGMLLDNMLGPINEMGEDELENEQISIQQEDNQKIFQDKRLNIDTAVPFSSDTLETHPSMLQSHIEDQPNRGPNETKEEYQPSKVYVAPSEVDKFPKDQTQMSTHSVSVQLPLNKHQSDFSNGADQNKSNSSTPLEFYPQLKKELSKRKVPSPYQGDHDSASLTQLKDNQTLTTYHDHTNDDPLGHIQWPKASNQLEGNYAEAFSPYSGSIVSQRLPDFQNQNDYNRRLPISSSRRRAFDAIPEEENMQIFSASQYDEKYLGYPSTSGFARETDALLLRPRHVQFISPKHKRKHSRECQVAAEGASEKITISYPGSIHHSQRNFVQPKHLSSEMASLIRANDGSIDGARCRLEPKDRLPFHCHFFFKLIIFQKTFND